MTTSTKCRAKNPATCDDPNCPDRKSVYEKFFPGHTYPTFAKTYSEQEIDEANGRAEAAMEAGQEPSVEDNAIIDYALTQASVDLAQSWEEN